MPLVFTPTTIGDQLNIGLTYRTAVIPDETADQLEQTFMHRINCLRPKAQSEPSSAG
jgi:hypothetical protein